MKELGREGGNGDKINAVQILNLEAVYSVEQEVKRRWKDSSMLQDTAQECREKWVQGWSSLMWLSESVSLTLGMGEGDVAVLSDVLLTQNINLLFYFLLLPCKLYPALFSTFWAKYCSVWMWDVGSCPVTFVNHH